jgi:hypothetical protein
VGATVELLCDLLADYNASMQRADCEIFDDVAVVCECLKIN